VTSDEGTTKQRYNVRDAAEVLGISPEAVRTRLSRGTLDSEREGRRVYVLLEPDLTRHDKDRTSDQTRYVRSLEERVEHLRELLDGEREANRENRRIIAALTSRIPELESGPSPGASESSPPEAQEPAEPRPWWRRWFGS
jgi:DNA-binding transcriptional regulator PaaX